VTRLVERSTHSQKSKPSFNIEKKFNNVKVLLTTAAVKTAAPVSLRTLHHGRIADRHVQKKQLPATILLTLFSDFTKLKI
jgi:hypothetical protein